MSENYAICQEVEPISKTRCQRLAEHEGMHYAQDDRSVRGWGFALDAGEKVEVAVVKEGAARGSRHLA